MGWTVTPVANDQGDVTGFDVDQGHNYDWKDGARDYVEDPITNQVSHVMKNVEFDEDASERFDQDEYFSTLASTYGPSLGNALAWAASGGLPADWVAEYNVSIDSGDLDAVNQGIESLMALYSQYEADAQDEVEPTEEEGADLLTYEDLSEEDQELVDTAVESLQYTTPQGEEYAQDWDDAMVAAQEAGDPTYALVCAATSAFHAGELDAQQCIEYCLQNADIRDLERVWKYINQ